MHADTARSELDSLCPARATTRRNFLVSGLGAGFALAVQPALAASAITTPADGLVAGEIAIPVGDGELPAYRAQPVARGPHPVVLVVQCQQLAVIINGVHRKYLPGEIDSDYDPYDTHVLPLGHNVHGLPLSWV